MRKALLVASGAVATAALIAGAIIVAVTPDAGLAPALAPSASASLSMPADRIGTRGLLPIEVDAELGALEVYLVKPDATLHPPPEGLRKEIWDLALRIMTPEEAAAFISYKVASSSESAWTAWVRERGPRDGWILGVNLARSDDPTLLAAALVHEYAHLIALRPGQVVPNHDGKCITVLLPEGCAAPGSYLDAYHHAFWAPYGDVAPDPGNTDPAHARSLFLARPGGFVSEYAAMNVVEGFAETFAAFVHVDGEVPVGAFEGKLEFFGRFQELVQIRERIRAELGPLLGSFRVD